MVFLFVGSISETYLNYSFNQPSIVLLVKEISDITKLHGCAGFYFSTSFKDLTNPHLPTALIVAKNVRLSLIIFYKCR